MPTLNKPGSNLEWCNLNPIDPTSLQPAIIEPSGGKKNSGFLRLEKPPRQDFNWALNTAGEWERYFETFTDGAPIINATHYNFNTINNGGDNLTALNNALAVGKKVFIPPGNYVLNGNPTIPDNTEIVGVPEFSTIASELLTEWDIRDKNIKFSGIRFSDFGGTFTINCGHSSDAGFSIFDKCEFTGLAILQLNPGAVLDSSGLVRIENCYFPFGDAITNDSGETACPRIIANGNYFNNSQIKLLSSSMAPRVFEGNIIKNSSLRFSGGGISIEKNFIESAGQTLYLDNALGGRFLNNIFRGSFYNINQVNPSRFNFRNNRSENDDGLIDDVNETTRGVRYFGTLTSISVPVVTTVMNFNTNRSIKMGRIDPYTKDNVEDGAGQFTYFGISEGETRIECVLNLVGVAVATDVWAFLRINGAQSVNFVKSESTGGDTILTLNTTLLLNKSDVFDIAFTNFSGGNITVGGDLNGIPSRIIVEGF